MEAKKGLYQDKCNDSKKNFRFLDKAGIEPVIKVKSNSSMQIMTVCQGKLW
jgi:arsenate reductase-like glutaredoxin family protein